METQEVVPDGIEEYCQQYSVKLCVHFHIFDMDPHMLSRSLRAEFDCAWEIMLIFFIAQYTCSSSNDCLSLEVVLKNHRQ